MFNKKLEQLIENILINKKDAKISGYPVFNDKAKFLCGSLLEGATYSLFLKSKTSKVTNADVKNIKKILDLTEGLEAQTFGIMGQLNGLLTLKSMNLYDQIIDKDTEKKLMEILHFNAFVDEENLKLKFNLPFNYYCVAFRCAKLRELLGWESEIKSDIFLDIYLEHSISNDFMDETFGEGRYDRYTLITPAEIAEMYVVAGEEVPEKIKVMLETCTDVLLNMSNETGFGIAYGRSLGVFGDTAIIEVLSIAIKIGILKGDKKIKAMMYCEKVFKRIEEFWYDESLESINIWLGGRKTDIYRNIHRIFGTNITTFLRCLKAKEYIKNSNISENKDNTIMKPEDNFKVDFYNFSSDPINQRSLILIKDGVHRFQLPVVNGGNKYYNKSPYYSIPFECDFIEGVPEVMNSMYTPTLTLDNEEKAMPISFIKSVECDFDKSKKKATVIIAYSSLCEVSKESPKSIDVNELKVTYVFQQGKIQRIDEIEVKEGMNINNIELIIPSFDEKFIVEDNEIRIFDGRMKKISINGLEYLNVRNDNSLRQLDTPTGSYKNEFIFSKKIDTQKAKIGWTIEY